MSTTYGSEEGIDHWRWPDGDGCHDECPACAEETWMEEVGLGNTRLGLNEWMEHGKEETQDENKVKAKMLMTLLDSLEQIIKDAKNSEDAITGALCRTLRAAISAARGEKA